MNPVQRDLFDLLEQSEQLLARVAGQHKTYKREPWNQLHRRMQFFVNEPENQWLILSGLRGIGKTTLIAQLFHDPLLQQANIQKFYFSMEQIGTTQDVILDFVAVIRYISQQNPEDKLILFIDEAHYHSQWALGCKLIFDQIPQVFIVCTGSSALELQLNPDSGRRVKMFKMHPLSLPDFLALRQFDSGRNLITPPPDLKQNLQQVLFDSTRKEQVYDGLRQYGRQIDDYYQQFNQALEQKIPTLSHEAIATHFCEEYINNYGTFPIQDPVPATNGEHPTDRLFNLSSEGYKYTVDINQQASLKKIVDALKSKDIVTVTPDSETRLITTARLSTASLNLLPKLINTLATSERISLQKIAANISHIHQQTLRSLLELLKISEIIHEIPPVGSSINPKNNKTAKYLFGAPALRQVQVTLKPMPQTSQASQLRGQLLEDAIAMYLKRIFDYATEGRVIEYDTEAGGADFVLSPQLETKRRIVVEVGYSKQTARQVEQTLQEDDLYGLVITNTSRPHLLAESNTVYVPLRYFMLS